ncbi:MAG: alkaline phosphatase family protein [Candidatus Lokiarchaeia archaeon]
MNSLRVCVVGLDGGTWNVIKPLIGKLPTFKKLIENGVCGELESTHPFFTSPAWKSFSTGMNPGKLGAYGWLELKNRKMKVNLSTSFKRKEIWDYLGEKGYKCVVINMPQTYPPKRINGVMISGFPGFDSGHYTYPKELKHELIKKFDYRISPKDELLLDKNKVIQEIIDLIKKRFLVAKYLWKIEKPSFLNLTIYYIDKVQHFFWNRKDILEKVWKVIDEELANLHDQIGEESYLFIISDHGFTDLKGMFRLNMWLRQKEYLHLKSEPFKQNSIFRLLWYLGLRRERIEKLIISLRLYGWLRKIFSEDTLIRVQHHLLPSELKVDIAWVVDHLDWGKTKAIMAPENYLYINIPKDSAEYDAFREKLIKEIKSIRDPRNDEKIVMDVKKREDIYYGEFLDLSPDLILVPNEGYRIYDGLSQSPWDFSKKPWSGYHKLHGIFIAYGPKIKKREKTKVRIYDIASTILHMFRIPQYRELDGRVLKEIFQS